MENDSSPKNLKVSDLITKALIIFYTFNLPVEQIEIPVSGVLFSTIIVHHLI